MSAGHSAAVVRDPLNLEPGIERIRRLQRIQVRVGQEARPLFGKVRGEDHRRDHLEADNKWHEIAG